MAFRQRPDGAIVIAQFDAADHDLTLDTLRRVVQFRHAIQERPGRFMVRVGKPALADLADRFWPTKGARALIGTSAVPEPVPNARSAMLALQALHRTLPVTASLALARTWACYFDITPDMLPVLGAVDAVTGLTLATGLSGHGFGMGPIIGKLSADVALGALPDLDIAPLSPDRFA